jgi:hypothetical protein
LRWLYVLDANEVISGCREGVIAALLHVQDVHNEDMVYAKKLKALGKLL